MAQPESQPSPSAPGQPQNMALLGIWLKLIAVLLFTVMLALAKGYSQYPLAVIIFFRSFFALVVLVVWLAWRGAFPRALHTRRLPAHLVRSIAGIGSMFFIFAAYGMIPLAEATAIGYVQPLMVALLAALILRERITRLRIASIAAGFAGVILMLWESIGGVGGGGQQHALGAFSALMGAGLVAIAFIQIRRLTLTEDTGAIAFYFQATTTLAALAVLGAAVLWPSGAPLAETMHSQVWVWPRGFDWVALILIGVLGGVGQILMTQGFRYADASILAVFDYSSLIWAVLIGLAIFGETPTSYVMAGAAIVIAAGLAVVWEENQLRKAWRNSRK
ncbi:MAG: DMT family transporter [Beijerinckiaceae bacterium]